MSKKKDDIKDDKVEEVTYKEIEYTCPVRGKVKQKVKVVKYKPYIVENKDFIKSSDSMINDFDMSELTGHALDEDDALPSRNEDDND